METEQQAEWVQEQKNRELLIYIGLCGLIDNTIIRMVKKTEKTNKLIMNYFFLILG